MWENLVITNSFDNFLHNWYIFHLLEKIYYKIYLGYSECVWQCELVGVLEEGGVEGWEGEGEEGGHQVDSVNNSQQKEESEESS